MVETIEQPETPKTPAQTHENWFINTRNAFRNSVILALTTGIQTGTQSEKILNLAEKGWEIAQKAAASGIDVNTITEMGKAVDQNFGAFVPLITATAAYLCYRDGVNRLNHVEPNTSGNDSLKHE